MTRDQPVPDVFAPVLTALQADASRHFGCSPVRLVAVEAQDRPFSYLLRVRVEGGAHPLPHLFVKVFKPKDAAEASARVMQERVANDYETTRQVHALMEQFADVGAVRPVVCYPEHLALVTEEVQGATLLDDLLVGGSWLAAPAAVTRLEITMSKVGRWIDVFQSANSSRHTITVDGLRRYIDVRLARLIAHPSSALTGQDRDRVLRHIDWLGAQIRDGDLVEVPVHSDMALGNILASGERVVVLDFAMAKRGSRLHDLTRVYVQMALLGIKPQIRASTLQRLQRALMTGFDSGLSDQAPLFRLSVLLHRVNHLATVTVKRSSVAESVYNRLVRRQHVRWISAEVARSAAA